MEELGAYIARNLAAIEKVANSSRKMKGRVELFPDRAYRPALMGRAAPIRPVEAPLAVPPPPRKRRSRGRSYEKNFKLLGPRIVKALYRLLPNLGGSREKVRRLYAGVVRSKAFYSAPVWSHQVTSTRRCKNKILSLQRKVATRMVRGYQSDRYTSRRRLFSEIGTHTNAS